MFAICSSFRKFKFQHFDFIFQNIRCFSDDVESVILRGYPDHLPEDMGSQFSLYLSSKLCRGIACALKTQLKYLTSKCMLSGTYTGLFNIIVGVLTTCHKQCT